MADACSWIKGVMYGLYIERENGVEVVKVAGPSCSVTASDYVYVCVRLQLSFLAGPLQYISTWQVSWWNVKVVI